MPTTNSGSASGSAASSSSSSQPLPPKENALFKRILKCYEQKQYKNGLKFAKQILSNPKFVEHGETLAMKGLTLNCLGRKEEAYDHVRRGLRNDLKSHVCWHVYGLLQRSDKRYDEAIKCYRNALKWDKDNIQILRDLSLLQIQMRDLDGYKDTRYQLFQLRPTQRASWIGFAMSYHLLNDHDMALKILEEFRKTQQGINREVVGQVMQALYNKKASYDYEHSELLLYQNMVIQESGDNSAALDHLNQYKDQICDKATFLENKGSLLIKNGRLEEAEEVYLGLLRRNPENHGYYSKLETASGCETTEQKLDMYARMREQFPKAQAPQRLPLNFAKGDKFRELLDPYLRKSFRKGVPPLFVDLRPLYGDTEKVDVIEKMCTEFMHNLKTSGSFDATGDSKEPVTALLWVYYFLGQHYDKCGEYQKALAIVDEAIDHTPTLIELFLLKGKIFKHVGDLDEAVRWLDEAQSLDTADRYINCKCAKYMLRAGRVKEAEEMCQKFTREGVSAMDNLNEMQCMWFQTECAFAFQRVGKWGEALKKCIEVDRHFNEMIEDQFDFHTYCMRKMTLRSYIDLLRLEDVIRSHRFYGKAARCAIQVYLRLHDKPLSEEDKLNDLITESMDPSELKKLRNKQKKAKRKAENEKQQQQQIQARKELHNKSQKKSGGGGGNADDDLDSPQKDELVPEKLERIEQPLTEAINFLRPLQQFAANQLTTHVLAFEIYLRKFKPLLMVQSIKRALRLASPDCPDIHGCLVRFQDFVERQRQTFPPAVQEVLKRETTKLPLGETAQQLNEKFIQDNKTSLPHIAIGAKMMMSLDQSKTDLALQLLVDLDSFERGVDFDTCSELFNSLSSGDFGSQGKTLSEKFRYQCEERFPLAAKFRRNEDKSKVVASNNLSNNENHVEVADNSNEP